MVADNKESAAQVKALFIKWVRLPHPHLLLRRANSIRRDEIMQILVGVTNTGLGRTVNKLRSYLLAAFNAAIAAEGDPFLAVHIGTGYDLHANPVAATRRVEKFDTALDLSPSALPSSGS